MKLGERITEKRKEQGMTQAELAEKMLVTRQTVSRWEAGAVYPDIEKIAELAAILNVSCDYLLTDTDVEKTEQASKSSSTAVTRLMQNLVGKKVKLSFYDGETDMDVLDQLCLIHGFEGNWMQVEVLHKKSNFQKLIAISTILSVEILAEQEV